MPARPVPRPGILAIEAYVPGKSAAPGVAKVHKLSSNETPLGPSPQAIEAVRAGAPTARPLSRRRGDARCARRSAPLRARPGAHRLRRRLRRDPRAARPRLSSGRATRRSSPSTASSSTGSPSWRPAARRWSRRRRDYTPTSTRSSPRVTPRTKIVFLANPNNPTGTYLPFDEVQAPARRPAAATCCWCSTRPTPNMCGATTTRPASSWSRRARTS